MPTPAKVKATKATPRAKAILLDRLSKGASFRSASAASGCHYTTWHAYRREDPEFNQQCEEARFKRLDPIVDGMIDRMINGVVREYYDRQGKIISRELQHPDKEALQLLRALHPDFNPTQRVEAKVESSGVLMIPESEADLEVWSKQVRPNGKDHTAETQ